MAIKPIEHYSMTNPASVYDEEAMTALELAGRTAAKVNETVDAINTLKVQTEAHLTAQDDDIMNRFFLQKQAIDAKIPAEVEKVVDEHINDGDFDAAIDRNIGNLGARVGVVEGRVNNLVSNTPSGSTTMDAEIIDARTSVNGKTYGHLRAAIHGEIARSIHDTPIYDRVNRYNPDTVVTGHYIEVNGSLQPNEFHNASDFMHVKAGEVIHFNYDGMMSKATFVYFYDESKKIFPDYRTNVPSVTVPEGAYYMRICHSATLYPFEDLFTVSTPYYGWKNLAYNEPFDYDPDPHAMYCGVYANRFNRFKGKRGAYVSFEDGRTIQNEVDDTYFVTNMIPIGRGEILKMCDPIMEKRDIRMVAYYDKNFNFLYGEENVTAAVWTDDRVSYARFTLSTDHIDDTIICTDDQMVYMSYGECVGKTAKHAGGGSHYTHEVESVTGVTHICLDDFPHYVKNNAHYCVTARFDTFSDLSVGRGRYDKAYGALWFDINAANILCYVYNSGTATRIDTIAHGLTISQFITVIISYTDGKPTITVITEGGKYSHTLDQLGRDSGEFFIRISENQTLYDVKMCATCSDFTKPVWLVGDSYFGFSDDRVVGALRNMGFKNYFTMGMSGLNSAGAVEDLRRALNYGIPNYIVWYLGMNDGGNIDNYQNAVRSVLLMCRERGITLIINRVPTVPSVQNDTIADYVASGDLRYIDSYDAVGANSSGAWIAGALSADNVHPTEYGATLLAARMLVDVPEIMSNGKE